MSKTQELRPFLNNGADKKRGGWLDDKHVLITGASGGIGEELSKNLIGIARRLTLVARNRGGKLSALAEELKEWGNRGNGHHSEPRTDIQTRVLDVCDREGMKSLVAELCANQSDQVDAFINCAGGSHTYATLEAMTHEDIAEIFDANARAPIFWLRELLPYMKRNRMRPGDRKRGHLVMLSSRSGERALPKLSVYAAAKGSIEKLVEAVRTEYAPHQIAFTLVNPGSINTPFTARWSEEPRAAHNAESMSVQEAVLPIVSLLDAQFSVNKLSYQSIEQWRGEPSTMKLAPVTQGEEK